MRSNRLKIALYTPSFPPKGGGIASVHFQLYYLLKEKYNVKVFIYQDKSENVQNKEFIYCDTPKWWLKILVIFEKFYLKRISKTDTFSHTKRIINAIYPIWKLNKPLKQFAPDIIIIPDNFVPAYALKKPQKSKLIWYSHHNYLRFRANPFFSPENWADIDVARSMERKALKKADAVICPSQYMVEEYYRAYNHKVPVVKIYNYFEVKLAEAISPKNPFQDNMKFPIVYIPSGGSEIKGKRYSYEIVRRLSNYFNHQIGFYISDYIPPDMQIELETIGNSYIHTPGHLPWEINLAIVKSCTIGISPTLAENFSAAILEAHSIGLPFVAFDTGGNKEIISNGKTGYIVPYLDVENLIFYSFELLKNNELVKKYSNSSEKHCASLINSNEILNEYKKCIKDLL